MVTGGAGFLGTHLCLALRSLGHDVHAVDAFRSEAWPVDDPERAPLLRLRRAMLAEFPVHTLDLLDRGALAGLIAGIRPGIIVHLASESLVPAAERRLADSSLDIVQSTANAIEAARAIGCVRRFVYVSSSMVYGHASGATVSEDAPLAPLGTYGVLKRAAEDLVRTCLAGSGIEAVVVRPTGVYGPLDLHKRVIATFCRRALAGEPISVNAGPDGVVDFTYIDDFVAGLTATCLRPEAAGETFNISFSEARPIEDIADILRRHVPDLRVIRVQSNDDRRPRRAALDISKARRLLGYAPVWSLERGLAACIETLRRIGHDGESFAAPGPARRNAA